MLACAFKSGDNQRFRVCKSLFRWRSTGQSPIRGNPGCITHVVLVRSSYNVTPIGKENTDTVVDDANGFEPGWPVMTQRASVEAPDCSYLRHG